MTHFADECYSLGPSSLTHWERGTHIYLTKLTIIDSDGGMAPAQHQAILRTNAETLLIRPLETTSEIVSESYTFSVKKMHLKIASEKWLPFRSGLNVLTRVHYELSPWRLFRGRSMKNIFVDYFYNI